MAWFVEQATGSNISERYVRREEKAYLNTEVDQIRDNVAERFELRCNCRLES